MTEWTIALAQMNPIIGALSPNRDKIITTILRARSAGAEIVIFPELALLGYPPQDLLLLPGFMDSLAEELCRIVEACQGIAAIVGTARPNDIGGEKGLYNSAAIIENGKLLGFQDKILLPDYDVFSERRYFDPAKKTRVWKVAGRSVGVTICEDMWQHAHAVEYTTYQRDPILELKPHAPEILVNLSASPFQGLRFEMRLEVCRQAAETLRCPVLYCNQVGGNDSLIFDGRSFWVNSQGELAGYGKSFEEDLLLADVGRPSFPRICKSDPTEDLFRALVLGIRDYFHKLGFSKACFGLSGGVDSSVVACLAKEALGNQNVFALSMPSRFSSKESEIDAQLLAKKLGISLQQIPIDGLFQAYLETLEPYFEGHPSDHTEENLQARIRGNLLMAFSNKFGYLTLGTGNKSEMAMGYSTLYGDMCGGLGILSDVTKELVYKLANWINRNGEIIPQRVLTKPPSAELRPDQKDTDTLPEYAIVDVVLQEYVENHLSPKEIAEHHQLSLPMVENLVQKIHQNEFKRQQAPPGLRVSKKAFTVGRKFPIVQLWNSPYAKND